MSAEEFDFVEGNREGITVERREDGSDIFFNERGVMPGFVLIAGCCELGFFRTTIGSLHVL